MGQKTFKTLYTELQGLIPNLPITLAKTQLQRAWEDVCNERQWSFLMAEGLYISPAAISTGAFSITQYSNTITANAAAITALTGLTNPVITQRQIRLGTSTYSITDASTFTVDGILTLDGMVLEDTDAAASYSIYRAYYGLPLDKSGAEVTDFLRFNSIYAPQANYRFATLDGSRQALDMIDPQRTISGNPTGLFAFAANSSGSPLWEMYPNPSFSAYFVVSYQRRYVIQSDTATFPFVIPDQLVMEKAQYYACLWADANKGLHPAMQQTNWRLLATEHNIAYSNPRQTMTHSIGLLETAKKNDEEMYPQNLIMPPSGSLFRDSDIISTLSGGGGAAIDIDGNLVMIQSRL